MTQTPRREIEPGDWVRFYQSGEMVIGVVQYIGAGQQNYLTKDYIQTDRGEVQPESILEVRPPKEVT